MNSYLSEQNSITEHVIAVFFKMVHYMPHSTGTNLYYWDEVFIYTIHIYSLTATSGLKDVIPYKA